MLTIIDAGLVVLAVYIVYYVLDLMGYHVI